MLRAMVIVSSILCFGAGVAQAVPGDVYWWYDENGQMHVSDQSVDVPAEKRKEVFQRAKDGEGLPSGGYTVMEGSGKSWMVPESEAVEAAGTPAPEGTEAEAEEEETQTKAYWQGRLAEQKAIVAEANAEIKKATAEKTRLMTYTPGGFQFKLAEEDAKIKEWEAKKAAAQYQLDKGLKEEARKKGIPPGWLR